MSFFKSTFMFKKSKPRKHVSKIPIKTYANDLYNDLGPKCEVVDVNLGDKKIDFDIHNGIWNTAVIENCGVATPNISSKKVQKQVEILQEENNLLKLKLEVLMNLIAESIADYLSTHSSTH